MRDRCLQLFARWRRRPSNPAPPTDPIPAALEHRVQAAFPRPAVSDALRARVAHLCREAAETAPADRQPFAWNRRNRMRIARWGSAVLAGHVDWHGVPGIFFRLRELRTGDPVRVSMSDGTVRAFRVIDARLVDKPELPRDEVFARRGTPTLALITCGGDFDRGATLSVLRFETGNDFLSRLLRHDVPGQQILSALRSDGRQAKRGN